MKHFTFIECKVMNQNENKLENSLATLATKSMLKKEKMTWLDQRQIFSSRGLTRTLVESNGPRKRY